MRSVMENEFSFEIKNSKFIGMIFPLQTKEEVFDYMREAQKKYPNATHYCYAYIFNQERYGYDDGEPVGTAGIPILQVLEKNNLTQVLCIVVRYFGKIKLGAGGLVRAYAKSAAETLKGHMVSLVEGYLLDVTFDYSVSKQLDYLLKKSRVLEKNFHDNITYRVFVSAKLLEELKGMTGVKIQLIQKTYLPDSDNN